MSPTMSALGVEQPARQAASTIGRRAGQPPRQLVDKSPRGASTALPAEHQREAANEQSAEPSGEGVSTMLPYRTSDRFHRKGPALNSSLALEHFQPFKYRQKTLFVSMLSGRSHVTSQRDRVAFVRMIKKIAHP